jgi:hypothetical protein
MTIGMSPGRALPLTVATMHCVSPLKEPRIRITPRLSGRGLVVRRVSQNISFEDTRRVVHDVVGWGQRTAIRAIR